MNENIRLLDPTAELEPTKRQRLKPPAVLEGLTIGLLDIGKARGNVFIDRIDELMSARGLTVKRYAKPTNTKVAPIEVAQTVAAECDIVVEALSD